METIAVTQVVGFQKIVKLGGGRTAARGNCVSLFHNVEQTAGNVLHLPRTPDQLAEAVYVVTPSHPGARAALLRIAQHHVDALPTDIPNDLQHLIVRPDVLYRALAWLRVNNPLYADVIVVDDRYGSSPTIPSAILTQVRKDLENGSGGGGGGGDGAGVVGEDDGLGDRQPHHLDEDEERSNEAAEETGTDREPVPLVQTASIPSASSARHYDELKDLVARVQAGSAPSVPVALGSRMHQLAHESTASLLPLMFPLLFPTGTGAFTSERRVKLTFRQYVNYLLEFASPRFQAHAQFIFYCYNRVMRRELASSVYFAATNHRSDAIVETLRSLDLEALVDDPSGEGMERLSKLIKSLQHKAPGSPGDKLAARRLVVAMLLAEGPPSNSRQLRRPLCTS